MSGSDDRERSAGTTTEAAPRVFSDHAIQMMQNAQMIGITQSRMADQKASILLGATFLVFSLSITRALTGEVPIALSVLAGFSFASSLAAVMAVLPAVSRAKPRGGRAANLLFFGDFATRNEGEWTEELLGALVSDETVLRAMAHDMYQNGVVLQTRKFRYLSIAYRLFVAGLVTTLLVFGAEMARSA